MNLVQKLPIGLGLACMMMLSSCSKEEVVAPEASIETVGGHSVLRTTNAPLTVFAPYLASTIGQTGEEIFPLDWQKEGFSGNVQSGTSSATHLWGNNLFPWMKPLSSPPTEVRNATILTIMKSHVQSGYPSSGVITKIKNLKPGKKYNIKVYVSSTIRNVPGLNVKYAKTAYVYGGKYIQTVDLQGKEAEWVLCSFTFDATSTTDLLRFSLGDLAVGEHNFANIFVDVNSIKQLN